MINSRKGRFADTPAGVALPSVFPLEDFPGDSPPRSAGVSVYECGLVKPKRINFKLNSYKSTYG